MSQEHEFEIWFDIFLDEVMRLGWRGCVYRDSARGDYDSGLNP